jgi:hypothetical protein
MEFRAHSAAVVAKNGSTYVLLKFTGHLIGEIPKELGKLKDGKTYRIIIEEEGD